MSKLWAFGDSFTAGFGCRWEENMNKETRYYKTFLTYYDNSKPIWVDVVADRFNLELENKSKSGYTNDKILDTILSYCNQIGPNDYVIIQSSTSGRFDFPYIKKRSLFGIFDNNIDKLYNTTSPYGFKTIFNANITEEYEKINPLLLTYTNSEEDINNENLKLSKEKYETIRNFFADYVSTGKYYEREMWRLVEIGKILKAKTDFVFIINESIWPDSLNKPDFLIDLDGYASIGEMLNKMGKTIKHETNGSIIDLHPGFTGHLAIAEKIINHIENINIHNS